MVKHRLAIVVPSYDEEQVLHETTQRLTQILDDLVNNELVSSDSYILYVNDGSTDNTWDLICEFHKTNKYVNGVNLAGNVGHQNALIAGLSSVVDYCDIAITIDADLQDDVNAIREMVEKYDEGCDIVYGVRKNRQADTLFKRNTALGFYYVMKMMGVKSVYNHADFRLMSKRALSQLLLYRERNLFLRGMVPTIGYKTGCVYYNRAERFAGESKYPLMKMINFAFDGITSFSIKPVRMLLFFGLIFILVAMGILVFVLYSLVIGQVVRGWTSLMLSIWFCSGWVLLGMGILGEYIGKIYIEVKDRPRYNIECILSHDNEIKIKTDII